MQNTESSQFRDRHISDHVELFSGVLHVDSAPSAYATMLPFYRGEGRTRSDVTPFE